MNETFLVPPRWSSNTDGPDGPDEIFFTADHTATNEGWWVMMTEESGAMILFTNLREEIAEHFKNRLEIAVVRYFEL